MSIVDQQQRQQALDTRSSFIVQAPAGSGKTELISQRFLSLLASVDQPEAVLAFTFTRKAASEMRLRITDALEQARQPQPEEAHKLKTWQLAQAVLKQDALKQWQLTDNPTRLQVLTIDSFNASLVRQMPFLSRLGASSSPSDTPQRIYLEAARRTLAELESTQWQADIRRLMLHLGNNINRIQELLVNMLARRDQWLRHITDAENSTQRREELESALQHLVSEHLHDLQSAFPAGMLSELESLLVFAAEHVDADKQPLIAAWKTFSKETPLLSMQAESLPYWQAIAELLLTKQNEARKSVNQSIGFPAPSSCKDKELKALYSAKKAMAVDLIAEISADETLFKLITALRDMPALTYTEEQWQLIESLSRILLLSAAQLAVVFGEQGQVDFSQVALSALQALGSEEDSFTDLAMILDYRIQHILVDEFQDTSQGQYALLSKLTSGWQPQDGRTLFLVGDPMQSIYRFREAEVGLYLKTRKQGVGAIPLTPLYLETNFRSQAGIVDWVNEYLSGVFAHTENVLTGAVTYNPSTAFHSRLTGQAVTLHPQLQRDDELEAEQVIDVLREELATEAESIAILVRSRSHLAAIIPALQQAGLAFQGIDLDPLQTLNCIIDLYTLTRALHHPADRLHWLALLRAPWCGLELADLSLLAETRLTLWQACNDEALTSSLSDLGQQRIKRLTRQLQPFIDDTEAHGFREKLEAAWHQLGGPVIYHSKTEQVACETYFNQLNDFELAGRINNLEEFDETLAQLYAPVDSLADGRLQIMTIHKSKGLEFDTVIIPGLGRQGKNDDPALLEWLERPREFGATDLLMAPIKPSSRAGEEPINRSLKIINREKASHELKRLLYVALTRGKHRLHLFASCITDKNNKQKPASNSLLSLLWDALKPQFDPESTTLHPVAKVQDLTDSTRIESKASDISHTLRRLPLDWHAAPVQPLDIPSSNMRLEEDLSDSSEDITELEFDWASETARHVGTLTHRYLERLARDSKISSDTIPSDTLAAIRNGLTALGTETDAIDQAASKVLMALQNTLNDERGQWILQAHSHACNEYALTTQLNGVFKRFVIDRTFIDESGTRWIIDYKTGSHLGSDTQAFLDREQQRYRDQLDNYAHLFSLMEDKPVRLGLYFPLLRGWREWGYPS